MTVKEMADAFGFTPAALPDGGRTPSVLTMKYPAITILKPDSPSGSLMNWKKNAASV